MGMLIRYTKIRVEKPGLIATLLRASYEELTKNDPLWEQEQEKWDEYDREVFAYPDTVGACLFLTRVDGLIAGFASWDPRHAPEYAVIGHNCILPEFRGNGLGRGQINEVLRRFSALGVRSAKVSTCDHPFFVSAQRMYTACGFTEVRRIPWEEAPAIGIIEYEKKLT
jgi:GNAT superfamily N-acetyltransferase